MPEHSMRSIILILCALCASSCLATSGEIDRAIADITGRIDVVARDHAESAEAAREAYRKGEITYAELKAALRDVTAASFDAGTEITKDVLEGVKETIENRPEVVAETVGGAAGAVIPGPLGQILEMLIVGVGTYAAAAKNAKSKAAEEADRVNRERDAARIARHEPVGGVAK